MLAGVEASLDGTNIVVEPSKVIAAVDGGMSRHAAAERFGVAVAIAIRRV